MDSAYHLWVNDKKIGYSQGSRNAAEFDISNVIRKDEVNTLRVKVYQWSDGSYVEDQDMWVCTSTSPIYLFPIRHTIRIVIGSWRRMYPIVVLLKLVFRVTLCLKHGMLTACFSQ